MLHNRHNAHLFQCNVAATIYTKFTAVKNESYEITDVRRKLSINIKHGLRHKWHMFHVRIKFHNSIASLLKGFGNKTFPSAESYNRVTWSELGGKMFYFASDTMFQTKSNDEACHSEWQTRLQTFIRISRIQYNNAENYITCVMWQERKYEELHQIAPNLSVGKQETSEGSVLGTASGSCVSYPRPDVLSDTISRCRPTEKTW